MPIQKLLTNQMARQLKKEKGKLMAPHLPKPEFLLLVVAAYFWPHTMHESSTFHPSEPK